MSDPAPAPASPGPQLSLGRAFALYTALRLLIFLLCWLALYLLGLRGLLAPAAAVFVSSLISLVVLRGQREAFVRAMAERADRREREREALRRRMDPDAG